MTPGLKLVPDQARPGATGGDRASISQFRLKAPSHPRLAVLLVTYNHRAYIQRALQSVVDQRVDADMELVVADDASSDGTREYIKEFMTKYPEIPVQFLDHSRNRGVTRNYQRCFSIIGTDYVAILEGDDYWIRPSKLSEQIKTLQEHPFCVGVASNYYVLVEAQSKIYPRVQIESKKLSFLDAALLINDNLIGNFSTTMYRVSALRGLPPAVFQHKSYDWIINILLMQQGPIAFLHEPMSVYRLHSGGTWSRMSNREKFQSQLDTIATYRALTAPGLAPRWDALANHLQANVAALSATEGVAAERTRSQYLVADIVMPSMGGGPMRLPQVAVSGRIVRALWSRMPKPMLNILRALSPSFVRAAVRQIGRH